MKQWTYARARLWTGISAVGTAVLLATLVLVTRVPAQLLGGRGGTPFEDAAWLFLTLGVAALAFLPFDVVGGLLLPRRFGRYAPGNVAFTISWLRGVLVLLVVSSAAGTALLSAGRAGGRPVALLVFAATGILMLTAQESLARWVGGLRRRRSGLPIGSAAELEGVVLLEGHDPGFSGGFTGALATPVVSAQWLDKLRPQTLELLVRRRLQIRRSGGWRRAVVFALLWNVLGFTLASMLPGAGVRTVAELVATGLGFTLWTFVGLLVLPTPSRRATVSADALVARDDESRSRLAEAVNVLDKLQDEEPERPAKIETVFHPVPSVRNRLEALRDPGPPGGAWHVARTALFLSYVGLSQLPRMVHCNVGRPELWVYMPTDG